MKKIVVVVSLILLGILLVCGLFGFAYYSLEKNNGIDVIGKEIILPDRIVYRNENGEYFEFLKDSEDYRQVLDLLKNSIGDYSESGQTVSDDEIDKMHSKSLIEFDYKTVSKNYIIPLKDNKDDEAIIKLADTGGFVCTKKLYNFSRIKKEIKEISKSKTAYNLDYKEQVSRNSLEYLDYKYKKLFKEINYKIYQIKIEDYETYEKFYAMCDIAIDEPVTKDTFNNNVVILTVSSVPKIDVKVSIGNIKYSYDNIENMNYGDTVHVLVVSKLVNTDCIYNTDLSEIKDKVYLDNSNLEYENVVENLDENIFMTNYDEFIEEYNNSSSSISEDEAKVIAHNGFKLAEKIIGNYDGITEVITEENVRPNNLFIRNYDKPDTVYNQSVDVYVFNRCDDIGNGVEIYVDKKLGKIVGGSFFGD